jgi:hypothetical protein
MQFNSQDAYPTHDLKLLFCFGVHLAMTVSNRAFIDALAVAALSAEGKTQAEISKALELSQSAVSRLLRSVQEDYIQVERKFLWEKLEKPLEQDVRRRLSHREIGDRLACLARNHGQPAPSVFVAPMVEVTEIGPQFDAFAAQAAMILRDLLEHVGGRVGVAWGSTLWHTTQALRSILPQRPYRERMPIEFVPLCGDPLIDSQERYADRTSSRIVSELSKAVNGDEPRPIWLGLVPAYIPRTFKKQNQIEVINQLIDLAPQYPRIFGPRTKPPHPMPAPIADDLHMIITAAGPSKRPLGFGRNPLLGLNDNEYKLLAEYIYGDIGGVLLPRLPNVAKKTSRKPQPHRLVKDLTRRWTGLRIEHLKACAARAFSEQSRSRPGVTLLSFGASHVEVVLEAVRQGLANQLILGSDLEEAMLKVLPRQEPQSGKEGPTESKKRAARETSA